MDNICKKLGINYKSMKLIIKHKLIMDKRRGEGDKNQLFNSLIIYFILGLFSMPIVGMNTNSMIKMSLFFSIFMVMILNVFITDFSNVILDIDDKEILLTKGIDSKTLNLAKFIHIIIYIGLISLSMSAGSIIVSVKYGIGFTLTLIVNILLVDILTLIISAIIYTVILKLFSGEKLKDMINGFQIAFLLLFVIGFQFVGRAFDISNLELIYNSKLWNILVPPMWFAANFNIISGENTDNIIKLMSLLSILLPIISLIIYLKMIPVFESNLQKLNDNSYKK
ncbi:MAG: ABC transporter permease, partial [Peptostreptococcaceae bacterium]